MLRYVYIRSDLGCVCVSLGNDMGVVPTGSQPTGILTLLFMMDNLDYLFTTHGSLSGWGH